MKLCIDPGHGNGNRTPGRYDPGAVSGGVSEADIVLLWALTLKWIGVHEFGVHPSRIVLTRDDSTDHLPVWKRDDIAVQEGCSHFLSLHCNAGPFTASGTETFWPGGSHIDDQKFARIVQSCALKSMNGKDRGLRTPSQSQHSSLAVFGKARSFSGCLLEIGFITNASDRKKMLDRNTRIEFARRFWQAMA